MGKLTASQKAARQENINSAMGKMSSVMSGVSSIFGSAMDNAQVNDTSGYEDAIDGVRNTSFDVGDYDTLMSAYNPLALNNRVTYNQIRGGSDAGRIGNTLSATANGALTGLSVGGPWGALAGAAVGLGAGIGGWIAGNSKAKNKIDELNAESHMASNEYLNNFSANAERIGDNMFRSKILNLAACGGFLPNKYAFGGLQPDYSNGATLVMNGGTHESNPYDGVQVGVDPQGVPNLVEEGEVIYDDYVYSNRLKPTKRQLESILLPVKYYGKTYAEIAKDIQKRSDETPNDPIERKGLEDGMYKLRAIQDETKQRMEQRRFMREFNKLSDDDKFALINGINQEAKQMQQQRLAENVQMADMQSQREEYDNQPQPNQEAGIASQMNQYGNAIEGYAYGGNLFGDGGGVKVVVPDELYKVLSLRNAYKAYKDGTGADMIELSNTTNTIKVPREVLDEFGLNKSFNEYTEDDLNKLYELNDFYSYYMPDVADGHISMHDVRSAYERYRNGDYSTPDEISMAAINGGRWYNTQDGNNGLNNILLPISGTDEYAGEKKYTKSDIRKDIRTLRRYRTKGVDVAISLSNVDPNHLEDAGNKAFSKVSDDLLREYGLDKPFSDYTNDEIFNYIALLEYYNRGYNNQMSMNRFKRNFDRYRKYLTGIDFDHAGNGFIVTKDGIVDNKGKKINIQQNNNVADTKPAVDAKQTIGETEGQNVDNGSDYVTAPEDTEVKESLRKYKGGKPKRIDWRNNDDIKHTLDKIMAEMSAKNTKSSADRIKFTPIGPVKEREADNDELPVNNPTWLRNVSLATSAGAVIGDLFGANNPDYSLWDNATKAANNVRYVSPTPLGDYLAYNPYDVNYMQGRINAQNAMAQRNILNTSSGNRGAAISGILASQQQGLNNMSDMYRQALEYNDKQRQAVADFNRGINQTNAQMSLQAQAQNSQLDRQRVSDLIQLAAQKQSILDASQKAKAENLTNLATLAGQYGKENVSINQLNRLINDGVISIGGNKSRNRGKLKRRRR